MKKTKLKLVNGLNLLIEINGLPPNIPKQDSEKDYSLLKEEIKGKIKYWLYILAGKLEKHKESFEKQHRELVKKYGVKQKDGSFIVSAKIEKKDKEGKISVVVNPKLTKFNDEYEEILNEEIEIEHAEFYLADISEIVLKGNYEEYFKLLEE